MRRICFCLCGFVFAHHLLAGAVFAQEAQPWKSDPKFTAALDEAHLLTRERRYPLALDAFRKANKIAGQKDAPVLAEQFDVEIKTGSYKEALATAGAISEAVRTPQGKASADVRRGEALMLLAGAKNKGRQLEAADAALKSALSADPTSAAAHYLDGKVLAQRGRQTVRATSSGRA